MATEYFIILAAGAAAGGFINGLAGFGTALLALGFWLQIMPPVTAVSMVVVMSVATGLQGVWVVRQRFLTTPNGWCGLLCRAFLACRWALQLWR